MKKKMKYMTTALFALATVAAIEIQPLGFWCWFVSGCA